MEGKVMAGWCERGNNDVEMWDKEAIDGRRNSE